MAPTTPESSGQLASRRLRGRYAETAFEEVIEANRRGTWTINAQTGCAVKRRWSTAGVNPPGNWFAPPGSNQSSSGGNETAEASGAEDREGDLASMQAVT